MMRAIRLSIIAAMLVLPELAGATTMGLPDDPGVSYLAAIFGGDLFGAAGGGQVTVVGQAMGALNTAVLAMASVFFAWQLISAIVQTSHSGEVLGKDWSSLWVPIRFVVAGILMIPSGAGGTILLQQLVAFVIKLGLDGGLVIASLAGATVLAGAPITAASPPSVEALAGNIWSIAVCNATDAQYGRSDGALSVPAIQPVTAGGGQVWAVPSQNWQDGSDCGSISYVAPAGAYAPIGAAWSSAINNLMSGLQPLATAAILSSRPDAPIGMTAPTPGQIADVVKATQKQLNSDVAGATSAVNASVTAALSGGAGTSSGNSAFSAMGGGGPIAQQLISCGWACFGAAWNTLAEAGSKFSHAVSQQPTFGAAQTDPTAAAGEDNADSRPGLMLARQLWDLHRDPAQAGWQPPAGRAYDTYSGAAPPGAAKPKKSDSGWIQRQIEDAIQNVVAPLLAGSWVVDLAADGSPNPLSRLTGLGITVQAVAIELQTAISAMSLLPPVAGFFSDGIGSNLELAMAAMLVAGTFLVDILPLLPAAIWGLAVVGWLILAAEALIAAPLWAFAHLKAGGQGIHGEAGSGYGLLLNLALRPALMAAGLVVGMAIFGTASAYLSQLFSLAILDGATENVVGQLVAAKATGGISVLISWIAKFCFFVSILTLTAERCFELIHQLPDTVMRWIGGSAAELGLDESSNSARRGAGIIAGAVKFNGPKLPKGKPPGGGGNAAGIENGDGGDSTALPAGEAGSQRG